MVITYTIQYSPYHSWLSFTIPGYHSPPVITRVWSADAVTLVAKETKARENFKAKFANILPML